MTTETLEVLVSDVVGFVVDEVGNDFTTALDVEVGEGRLGHGLNQWIRARFLNVLPMGGGKQRMTCRLSLTCSMKNFQSFSAVSTLLGASFFMRLGMSKLMESISLVANRD